MNHGCNPSPARYPSAAAQQYQLHRTSLAKETSREREIQKACVHRNPASAMVSYSAYPTLSRGRNPETASIGSKDNNMMFLSSAPNPGRTSVFSQCR